MTTRTTLKGLRRLMADDGFAATFQTMGQYRTALLKACDDAMRAAAEQPEVPPTVTDEMVSRFLGWRLPEDFYPDCYVSFDREKASTPYASWPIGTNLLHAGQARAMLEHVLATRPSPLLAAGAHAVGAREVLEHELKCDPIPFTEISEGRKGAEVRRDDRDFQVGDKLWLRETTAPAVDRASFGLDVKYTGRELRRTITHIQRGYGLPTGIAVLSFGDASVPWSAGWIRDQIAEQIGMWPYSDWMPVQIAEMVRRIEITPPRAMQVDAQDAVRFRGIMDAIIAELNDKPLTSAQARMRGMLDSLAIGEITIDHVRAAIDGALREEAV